MKKSTLAAGCIAGIVAACSGAGMEAIGDTMRDAGEALAGAGASMGGTGAPSAGMGGMLATAGHAVADAGRAIAGASGNGTAGAKAQEDAGAGNSVALPQPHWVLRDKDGTPVQAMVEPGYATTDRFNSGNETCVWVERAGSRAIQLAYNLATGTGAKNTECTCGQSVSTINAWRDSGDIYFADAACAGPTYQSQQYEKMWSVGGALYYPSSEQAPAMATLYKWNSSTSTCTSLGGSTTGFRALKPVPTEVVNLLPNAPYTLELVY
jgi:hypothetical protein